MDDTNMFNCLSLPYQSIMNQCNVNERYFYTIWNLFISVANIFGVS